MLKLTDELQVDLGVLGRGLPEVDPAPVDAPVLRPQRVNLQRRGNDGGIGLGEHARLLEAKVGSGPGKSDVVLPMSAILASHVKAEKWK